MRVSESGKVTLVRRLQPLNACWPKVVTFRGIVMLVKSVFVKAN